METEKPTSEERGLGHDDVEVNVAEKAKSETEEMNVNPIK